MTLPPGAYGLKFQGLPAADALIPRPPGSWPVVRIELAPRGAAERPERRVEEHAATLRLVGGGVLELDRHARCACFRTPEPIPDDELVHPYLAPVASVFGVWLGRDSLHAAAYVVEGRAVALLGGKEAGKSTTVAALAAREVPILTDDILIVERGVGFAGPRAIDARARVPRLVSDGTAARGGERTRYRLPPVEAQLPVAGLVFLAWGDRVELVRLPPAERPVRIALYRWDPTFSRPASVLDLAALPAWELRRPLDLGSLDASCDLLVSLGSSI